MAITLAEFQCLLGASLPMLSSASRSPEVNRTRVGMEAKGKGRRGTGGPGGQCVASAEHLFASNDASNFWYLKPLLFLRQIETLPKQAGW